MRKYLSGRIKGQQRLWMDAHFRGDIDDQPPPPRKEKTYINKLILCSHYFVSTALDVCDNTFQPCLEQPAWSSEWRKYKSLLFFYTAITKSVFTYCRKGECWCLNTKGTHKHTHSHEVNTIYKRDISYMRDRQHVAVDNLSDFLVKINKQWENQWVKNQRQTQQPESLEINHSVFRKWHLDCKPYLFSIWYFQEIGKVFRIAHSYIVNCMNYKEKNHQ